MDIVIATPGRLMDLTGQRFGDFSGLQFLVLDEADRMLDMGFIRDIRKVLAVLPPRRQPSAKAARPPSPCRRRRRR